MEINNQNVFYLVEYMLTITLKAFAKDITLVFDNTANLYPMGNFYNPLPVCHIIGFTCLFDTHTYEF